MKGVKITRKVKELIEGNALALANVNENGSPHCIAVGQVKVVSSNQVLIGNCFMKETIKNIQRNQKVALAVWSRNWEKDCLGYEFEGIAQYFTDGRWYEMVKKVHKEFSVKGAILMTITKIKKLA
jgi:predicted pyridoxine 5'-phosphate oxidase superfamily flavin-nucleotide-binding protein